jgi:Glutathione S-transferase, N-terminal domain
LLIAIFRLAKVAETEKRMRLYEFAPTRSIRARWTLQELGIDFESVTVNLVAGENRRPEFLKINPAGRVPVLVDDDLVLTESVAIVLYLAEKYPTKGWFPPTSSSELKSTVGFCSRPRSWSNRYGASRATLHCIQNTCAFLPRSPWPARISRIW